MKKFIFFLLFSTACIALNADIFTSNQKSSNLDFRAYKIGDVVENFSWEHSNGKDPRDTISLAELIADKKAVMIEFSQAWCPFCNEAAPHLQEVWNSYDKIGNNKLYVCAALTENIDHTDLTWEQLDGPVWREKYGITHHLAMSDLYSHEKDFTTTGIPTVAIIAKDSKLFWCGHPLAQGFDKIVANAAYSFQSLKPNFGHEVQDQKVKIGNDLAVDFSNAFLTKDSAEWILEVVENTDEDIVSATVSGKNIILTAKKTGTSSIRVRAINGDEDAFASFNVTAEAENIFWAQWGSDYVFNGAVGVSTVPWDFAVDFDFGKDKVDVYSFAVGMYNPEDSLSWKIVKVVDGKITDDVIGDLKGSFNALGRTETIVSIESETKITGHVALVIHSSGNLCGIDKGATSDHTWIKPKDKDWGLLTSFASQHPGAWYTKLGVSKLPCDYYVPILETVTGNLVPIGEDMDITITISDDSGLKSVKGLVNIDGEESQVDFTEANKQKIILREKVRTLYTFKGTIPAKDKAVIGSIKFDMTDSSEEANNIVSEEYKIEWEPNIDWALNENFEGSFPPAGWKIIDADGDGDQWIQAKSPSMLVHDGSKAVSSASFNNKILTPDNWLILPLIHGASRIRYWVAAQDAKYPADKYGIFVSETGTDPADFTEVFSEIMTAKDGGTWYRRTVDLSEYSDKDVYVAIRHWDCTDQFKIVFDEIKIDGTCSIQDQIEVNKQLVLYQNYPNPFNPTTTISFNLNKKGNVKLSIYNLAGKLVNNILSKNLDAGVHSIKFDGSKLNSGTYFYKLETANNTIVKKMLLLK